MSVIPAPGQVIRYSYLWKDEHLAGREEGSKDRPCVIVIAVDQNDDGTYFVTVVPVTHSSPSDPSTSIEIPHETKVRLRLDNERSWIILTEANQFAWPGPDIRPISGQHGPSSTIYGLLPHSIMRQVSAGFIATMRARRSIIVPRTE